MEEKLSTTFLQRLNCRRCKMNWKKLFCLVCLGLLVAGSSWPAFACDLARRSEITVQAPLDAVNCGATPATITVLGLNIDISAANLNGACTDLTVGQVVEVTLASDNPVPATGLLLASRVEMMEEVGCHDGNVGIVKIAAPIQAIDTTDPNVPKVKLLGLVIDISKAILIGDDDDEPLNVSQLAAGQFAMIWATTQPQLAATMMRVHQLEIKVQAPLDAINCGATPATITVLGLNIDISKASLNREHGGNFACADLTVGQVVEVTLASDIPDSTTNLFSATEVELEEASWCEENTSYVKIAAPLQAIDPSGTNVTVLGLVIDITKAKLMGDDNNEPIILSQRMVGQFAFILATTQPQLSATVMWVHPAATEISVQAPLGAINCGATSATITVLGLNIDISKASLYGEGEDNITCADLTVGQWVKVVLASDIPDPTTNLFSATEVELGNGSWCDKKNIIHVKIAAPLQAIGSNNVTVLGLVIDISQAILELDNGLPVKASQLTVGQYAKLTLAPDLSKLSAIILVAQASSVQATVQVLDNKGKPVNDGADNDIHVQVTVGQGKKARIFNFSGNGKLYLSGLPKGSAKVVVTRVRNGQKSKGSSSFTVKANNKAKAKYLLIRLKPVKR